MQCGNRHRIPRIMPFQAVVLCGVGDTRRLPVSSATLTHLGNPCFDAPLHVETKFSRFLKARRYMLKNPTHQSGGSNGNGEQSVELC